MSQCLAMSWLQEQKLEAVKGVPHTAVLPTSATRGLQCQAHLASKGGPHCLKGLKQVLDVLSLHRHQRAALLQGMAECLDVNAPHQQAHRTSNQKKL